jgi:hypothetical protein
VVVKDHAKTARGKCPGATQVLGEVKRAASRVRRARENYRAALVEAVAELEAAGVRDPFARVAAAAGVSKQAVRELVERARS